MNPDGTAGTTEAASLQPGTGARVPTTELNFAGAQTWDNLNLVLTATVERP